MPTSVVEVKKRKPVLFLRLASTAMKCLYHGLVKNANSSFQKYVQKKITVEHISSLALLVQNLDTVMSTVGSNSKLDASFCSDLSGFGFNLMELLQEMIVNGIINRQCLQVWGLVSEVHGELSKGECLVEGVTSLGIWVMKGDPLLLSVLCIEFDD